MLAIDRLPSQEAAKCAGQSIDRLMGRWIRCTYAGVCVVWCDDSPTARRVLGGGVEVFIGYAGSDTMPFLSFPLAFALGPLDFASIPMGLARSIFI